jgi:single-strand DNA-binding protein
MASRSLNKVMIIGHLTRDPELKYTSQGTALAKFGVATNRTWSNDRGEQQEDVEYHNCVAWGKLAEICDQILNKGSQVYVEGRLNTNKWETDDGQKRSRTEIVVNEMNLLSGSGGGAGAGGGASRSGGQQGGGAPDMDSDSDAEDIADDIPF